MPIIEVDINELIEAGLGESPIVARIPDDIEGFATHIMNQPALANQVYLRNLIIRVCQEETTSVQAWRAIQYLMREDKYNVLDNEVIVLAVEEYLEGYVEASEETGEPQVPPIDAVLFMDRVIRHHDMNIHRRMFARVMDDVLEYTRPRGDTRYRRVRDVRRRYPSPFCSAEQTVAPLAVLGLPDHTIDGADGFECAICLGEDPSLNRVVTQLPCGHEFDRECARRWLRKSRTCPVCRYDILDAPPNLEMFDTVQTWDVDRIMSLVTDRVSRWTTGDTTWFMDTDGDMVRRHRTGRGKTVLRRITFQEWLALNEDECTRWTVRILDDSQRFPNVSKAQFNKDLESIATPMRLFSIILDDTDIYKLSPVDTVVYSGTALEPTVEYI